MELRGESPSKIRFLRRQMNYMCFKACVDVNIPAFPSRHTYVLNEWLNERMINFYPQQEGFDEKAMASLSVQYPVSNAVDLPDAVKGDKKDKWALVSLLAEDLTEMSEWEISFTESFPLSMANIKNDTKIPGLIIFSQRALPLSAWMSGLELGYLNFNQGKFPCISLETGISDSWVLANLTDKNTLAEAEGFETAKRLADGVHFLAVQSSPESESFEGFWLLKEFK